MYLLVEIKVREFRAKLLLASIAARHGYRVYLGTRSAVMEAVQARPRRAGVYYFKGGEPPRALSMVADRCEFVVGQDEEIGPALNPDDVAFGWRARYSGETSALIDQIYLFSSPHLDVLRQIRPELADKAKVTGWPRVDLWREEFRAADDRRASALRQRYGPYVLFVSNFKVNSEEQRQRRIEVARASRSPVAAGGEANTVPLDHDYGTYATHRLESYQRAVEVLREVGRATDGHIVVRAHPAEDPARWQEDVAGVPGISVVSQGEAGPWLLAAAGVLHAGCTTAVEAALYGVPCGYLEQVGYLPGNVRSTGSYQVSMPLVDVDEAVAFVEDALSGRLEAPAPRDLPESAVGPRGGLASERIVRELAALPVTPEPPLGSKAAVAVQRRAARVVSRWRAWVTSGRAGPTFVGTNAQAKVPGGLHLPEARRILAELGQSDGLVVDEPRFNLLRIEDVGTTPPG